MSRQHARIEKPVINLDHAGDKHVMCAWDTCDRDGYELHKIRINYGKPGSPHIVWHVFCSDSHRDYFINNLRKYGYHTPGYGRGRLL
jgi:hypothetical protein